MRVLGIETSCDETGVGLYDTNAGLLAHALHSQVDLHARYGGVVPELASRDHIIRITPLIREVLDAAGLEKSDLDGIAYTAGPGLIGALLVGTSVGRSLAYGLGIPAIAVHHMEAHLLAPIMENPDIEFPFVALLVSGGHTLLMLVKGLGEYEMLGQSLDDAAGEAFDKTAKLMGLGYPGGPALSKLANEGRAGRYQFPRPMTDRPGLDFSFSGLKTFALNTIQAEADDAATRADIARAFVDAVVDTLLIKCKRALQQTGSKRLIVAGGVSANVQLRQALNHMAEEQGGEVYFPGPEFCTDNGAMIAYAGAVRLEHEQRQGLGFQARPRWPMSELESLSAN